MDNKFVLSESFNDIVFEKRNKKYGAYDIRRKYTRYAVIAGAAAILFFTCGSITWAFINAAEDGNRYAIHDFQIAPDPVIPPIVDKEKDNVETPKPKEIPPVTSAAELGPKTQTLTNVINIVDDSAEVPPSNLMAGMDPKGLKGGTGTGPVDTTKATEPCPDCDLPPVPVIVEWAAFPPTCEGLDIHLQQNIKYPQICKEMGIEGTVYVEFIVDTKGNYRDVKVLKGPHPALNAEALRVMSKMPAWTPAKDDKGTLVEFIMRKPIRFQLQ